MNERSDAIHMALTPVPHPVTGLLPASHSGQAGPSGAPLSPVALAPLSPEVADFQDYRAYLTAWFQWKKQVQPHFSGAVFAKKAGFNSHTLLGMVIRGQRNLSSTSIRSFCRALGLQGREATHFEKLVLLNQARNADDQSHYQAELHEVSKAASPQQLRTLTFAVSRKDLGKLMERIDEFERHIQAEFAGDEMDQVLVVNAALVASCNA